MKNLIHVDKYRKAMFFSYGLMTSIFFILPFTLLTLASGKVNLFMYLEYIIAFLFPVFLSGYFISPFAGRTIEKQKFYPYLMACISLIFGAFFFMAYQFLFHNMSESSFSMTDLILLCQQVLFIVIAGCGPALLAAVLFIGGCKH